MSNKSLGYDTIENSSKTLSEVAKFLYANPELAFKEFKAHDYLCNLLQTSGFKVERNFLYQTGFRATFETAAKPHFVIMVEYDALPNLGHACGHNCIAESSIATALGLMAVMKKGGQCKLSVFGTPAEEDGGGKIKFITDGFFKDVDAVVMSHPCRADLAHMNLMAVVGLDIKFTGKESHAAAAPWEGKNALDAAVLAYQSISCLRQQIKPSSRVHGIITYGGSAPNVIPNRVEMKYFVRDANRQGLKDLLAKIYACFESGAKAAGCEVTVTENGPVYEDLISNSVMRDLFIKNGTDLGITFQVDPGNVGGSSDAGNVSQVVPTIHPWFNIGTTDMNHTVGFANCTNTETAHLASIRQGKAMLGVLVDILEDTTGQILVNIKEAFKKEVHPTT